ncbi:MAG: hypothetical protein GY889_12125 [Proteobacteria bacterium]|nr:hypothetical protein [Pseudomonadota bacterium]
MQLEQYTPDAICNAMCIGPLVDPSWSGGTLAVRLLLKPSFHPEACITITQSEDDATLSVSVLAKMLWREDYPCRLPAYHDDSVLTKAQFTRLAQYHHEAVTDPDAQRTVCLDGMGVNCAWTTADGNNQLQSHIVDDSLRTFAAQMIDQAWQTSGNAGVRNGLAECARYVGAEYPLDPIPSKPTLFRLGVFGTPDDVDDYFRALKAANKEA